MDLQVEKSGTVSIVRPEVDVLDGANAKTFKEAIARLVPEHPRMVLDLARVTFVDSAGLGAILSGLRQLNAGGGDLKLCGVTPAVRSLLEMVRMHKIVEIYDGRDAAVTSWSG